MSQWATELDPPKAQSFADRWQACSEQARDFAASYGGHWAPMLPHVVAELFDAKKLGYGDIPPRPPSRLEFDPEALA